MVIFPLAPDQTIAQMWSNGARGGSVNLVGLQAFSCTSFLHAIEHCSIPLQDRNCPARDTILTVQRDWVQSGFGARNCDEFASKFSCKFLVQDDLHKFLMVQVS